MEENIVKQEIAMDYLVKFATTCYPDRNKPLITKKP